MVPVTLPQWGLESAAFKQATPYTPMPSKEAGCTERRGGVKVDYGHSQSSASGSSLHAFANLDQQLITCLEADQTGTWVLNVEDDIDDDNRDNRETEDVKPTPMLAAGHPITSQQGTDETKAEQKRIYDSRGMDLQRHRARGGDANHVVERRKQQLARVRDELSENHYGYAVHRSVLDGFG